MLAPLLDLDFGSGNTDVTVHIAWQKRKTGGTQTILSNWETGVLIREDNGSPNGGFSVENSFVSVTVSDLSFTQGVEEAFSVRYNGSTIEAWKSGAKSTDSTAETSELDSGSETVYTGFSPHAGDSASGMVSFALISDEAKPADRIVATQRMVQAPQTYLTLGSEDTQTTARTLNASFQGAPGTLNADLAPTVTIDAGLQGAAGTLNADLSTSSTLTIDASLQGASGTLNASITEADVKRLATLNAKLTD
jgi:hypothetical protein